MLLLAVAAAATAVNVNGWESVKEKKIKVRTLKWVVIDVLLVVV